ncbi:hypothetical protein EVAR_74602_1 [Eumeta japonica]|uniref:Uncharacterized protein n=1 Tax=Eumeta variegata TaxID=151549 RepID=A0A4C1WD89_EUMVA|nr:hypothetical protein EVAR_74602_1 [Eumeta japonica]
MSRRVREVSLVGGGGVRASFGRRYAKSLCRSGPGEPGSSLIARFIGPEGFPRSSSFRTFRSHEDMRVVMYGESDYRRVLLLGWFSTASFVASISHAGERPERE